VTAEKDTVAALESNAGWVSAPVKISADCVAVDSCASGDDPAVPTATVDDAL